MTSKRVTISQPATRARAPRVTTTPSLDQTPQADQPVEELEERQTVLIPADFTLTLDNGTIVKYSAGIDEMPVSHINHWFTKNMGVEIYDATKEE